MEEFDPNSPFNVSENLPAFVPLRCQPFNFWQAEEASTSLIFPFPQLILNNELMLSSLNPPLIFHHGNINWLPICEEKSKRWQQEQKQC